MKPIYTILLPLMVLLLSSTLNAQNRTITGTVINDDKKPVSGATVFVETDKNIRTQTDNYGNFSLNVPESTKNLLIQHMGMRDYILPLLSSSFYAITLQAKQNDLDEVVVVGYGTMKKSDLTGAITSIESKDLKGRFVSIEQGLQGRIPGVQITQTEGSPDGAISVVIRGSNSIVGGTEPLYVVDGIPISGGNKVIKAGSFDSFGSNGQPMTQGANMLSFLNPSDIESVQVLKDASATAIYGSRASNGVVLITTKKGSAGSTNINVDASWDIANVMRKWDLLSAAETAEQTNTRYLIARIMRDNMTYEEALKNLPYPGKYNGFYNTNWTPNNNSGGDGAYQPSPEDFRNGNTPSTDWQDVIMRTGVNKKFSISLSGGNEKTNYYVGTGMDDIEGVLLGSAYKRYSVNSNVQSKMWSFLNFSNSSNLSYSLSNRAQVGNLQSGDMKGLTMASVLYNPIELISSFRYLFDNGLVTRGDENPYITATQLIDKNTVYTIMDNMALTADLAKGLKFKVSGGLRFNYNVRDYYIPTFSNRFWDNIGGYATYGNALDLFFINENLLIYNKDFDNKHKFDVVAGFTQETTSGNDHAISTTGFLNDINTYYTLGSGERYYRPKSNYWQVSAKSWLSRINYNFLDRYLVTVSFRADGSSKFGKNHKWGYFPSAAVAWRIDQENFMKNIEPISNLKLRLSYGKTGNQGLSPYQSQASLVAGTYPSNGQIEQTYAYSSGMPNPDLRWESTKQYNAAIDLGLFKNRLSFTAEFYNKKTVDLLQNLILPANSGFSSVYKNVGSLRNVGTELSLNGILIDKKDVRWNVALNWSTNRLKVLNLGGVESLPGYNVWGWSNFPFPVKVGHTLGEIWGYRITNLIKTQEDLNNAAKDSPVKSIGQYDFEKDENGNMKQVLLGNTNPDYIFGVSSSLDYKNFDFSFSIAGAIGQNILNVQAQPGFEYNYRVHGLADDRWIPDVVDKNGTVVFEDNGKNGYILEPLSGNSNYGEKTYSSQVEDGSWIKMRYITLGYTYRVKKASWIVSSIRPFITVNNVFSIDSYSGLDPESSIYGQNPIARGAAFSEYPMTRSFTFGVKFNL